MDANAPPTPPPMRYVSDRAGVTYGKDEKATLPYGDAACQQGQRGWSTCPLREERRSRPCMPHTSGQWRRFRGPSTLIASLSWGPTTLSLLTSRPRRRASSSRASCATMSNRPAATAASRARARLASTELESSRGPAADGAGGSGIGADEGETCRSGLCSREISPLCTPSTPSLAFEDRGRHQPAKRFRREK